MTETQNGAATITATSGQASGTAAVTINAGGGLGGRVTGRGHDIDGRYVVAWLPKAFDANGHLVAGAEFSWSSSDGAVAEVGGGGVVRGTT